MPRHVLRSGLRLGKHLVEIQCEHCGMFWGLLFNNSWSTVTKVCPHGVSPLHEEVEAVSEGVPVNHVAKSAEMNNCDKPKY